MSSTPSARSQAEKPPTSIVSTKGRVPWLVKDGPRSCRILLHVQPKASRTELAGEFGDRLKLRVAAPPVDGKANRQILQFLSTILDLPKSRLVLERGASGRDKTVVVPLPAQQVQKRLAATIAKRH